MAILKFIFNVGRRLLRTFKKNRLIRFTWKHRLVRFAFLGLLLFYLVGFFGPLLAPYDPLTTNLEKAFLPPSKDHLFGTDALGRDVFSRVLCAMRTTSIISLLIFILGGWVLNVGLGLIAGYYGGRIDSSILRVGETISSVPPLVFLIIFLVSFRDSFEAWMLKTIEPLGMTWLVNSGVVQMIPVIVALALISWVGGVYTIRSRVLQERELGYVESLRILGASERRIIFGHILPNVMGLVILSLSAVLISAIGLEVGLSFLALGIRDPYPSFGIMFYQAASLSLLRNHPHLLIIPGIIVSYIGMLCWVLGDQWGRMIESKRSYE